MEGKRGFILVGFIVFTEFMDGDRAGQLEESGQRLSSIIHDITEVLCTSENEKARRENEKVRRDGARRCNRIGSKTICLPEYKINENGTHILREV